MGWGNCGTDSQGRGIGYVFEGTCDHPGCDTKIDRGLSFACGGMHGEDQVANDVTPCEKYFCTEHLHSFCSDHESDDAEGVDMCLNCCKENEKAFRTDEIWQPTGIKIDPDYNSTFLNQG